MSDSVLRSGQAVMAEADVAWHREQVRLKSANALRASVPVTAAGKWAALEMLLNPVYVETCPCCGQDVEKRGEPLISLDAALELLGT